MQKLIYQVAIITIISTIIGVGLNLVRATRIGWTYQPPKVVAEEDGHPVILNFSQPPGEAFRSDEIVALNLGQVYEAFKSPHSFLIDARGSSAFSTGHIPSAVNVPYEEDFQLDDLVEPATDKYLVLYCDGGTCTLAEELAGLMSANGFKNLYVFPGGIEEWQQAGYPLQ